MTTASQIVWEAHGSPRRDDCEEASGRCWVCGGQMTRGQPVKSFAGAGFTGQNRIRCPSATHVCEPCVHVCSRVAPVLGRPAGACSVCNGTLRVVAVPKAGKGRNASKGDECPKCDGTGQNPGGGSFRNYSHLWEDGHGYANASKGEKPLIREFLSREHQGAWFAALADSGQKHVIPWTPVNPRGGSRSGRVLFDEEEVLVPDDQSLIDNATALLTLGLTKDELATGDYRPRALLDNREAVEHFEFHHGAERGGGWFALAIFLAQRDEEKHAEHKRARDEARKQAGRVHPSRPKRVPQNPKRKATAVVLADAPGESPGSSPADRHSERVGGDSPARDADPGAGQQSLPGLG